jgi:hypothetical protein
MLLRAVAIRHDHHQTRPIGIDHLNRDPLAHASAGALLCRRLADPGAYHIKKRLSLGGLIAGEEELIGVPVYPLLPQATTDFR